jgi:ferredoxin
MAIKKVYALYFSPTGTTEKATVAMAEGMGVPFEKIDLTLPKSRRAFSHAFNADEMVIAGFPVYGGRLPRDLEDCFSGLKGHGALAAALVMYGNREYDDALIELKMRLEECGFTVAAGAAFVGEHTFSRKIATGRPDKNDLAVGARFGKEVMDSLSRPSGGNLALKGNYPFKMSGYDPRAPGASPAHTVIITTTEDCTNCGLCAEECPWGVIDMENPGSINYTGCMRCLRCIKICPNSAKKLTSEKFLASLPQFEARLNAVRKEPELFLRQPSF